VVFGDEEVVGVILAFVPTVGGVLRAGLTSPSSSRALKLKASARLRDALEGTGLSLDVVQRSRVLGDVPAVGLEAILRAMRRVNGVRSPRREETRNDFDGLVFCLSLIVDGKPRVLRLLEGEASVAYEGDDGGPYDGGELVVTFARANFEPIPTKRQLPDPNDADDCSNASGAAQLFVAEEDDVEGIDAEQALILKVTAYDSTANVVAHVYEGKAVRRILPYYLDWEDDDHLGELLTRFGFYFQSQKGRPSSSHVLATGAYRDDGELETNAALYFDAPRVHPFLPPDELDEDFVDLHLNYIHWQLPIGTNFDTLELRFGNVDNVRHLKSVLTWKPLCRT